MTKLVLRREARADLDGIDAFSIEQFGEDIASAYMENIRLAFRRLRAFPRSGAKFRSIRPPIRYLPCGSHRILYDYFEDDDIVVVVRILHQAMNAENYVRR